MTDDSALWSMSHDGFRHEALLYDGDGELVSFVASFVRAGLADGEPALVVVGAAKLDVLRDELSGEDGVVFADMEDVGRNPARIIPAWRSFVDEHGGNGRIRGVGEPIDSDRSGDALLECERHEDLLNLAFADANAFWLLCPYDTGALPDDVVERARSNHPFVASAGRSEPSASFRGVDALAGPFTTPLSEPPSDASRLVFGRNSLRVVRRLVADEAARAGFEGRAVTDLVLAVHEVAVNSVRHGGGGGELLVWRDGDLVVCEVRDRGVFAHPLADRLPVPPHAPGGRGLWLANAICELVQIRSVPDGTVVRLHYSDA